MIPLSVPHIAGNEWTYVKECLDTGWISSVGSYVTTFENKVAEYVGSRFGVACVNGTNGLHIALIISKVLPGDMVIVPNITFVASLNAIKYAGAVPILVDIDPDTWQMDINLLEKFLEQNTTITKKGCIHTESGKQIKAIMPVHVLGNMTDMSRLQAVSLKYDLVMIEDSTEALGSYYKNKHAGTFGRVGVFSFNGNKIISTGGGGVIVTNDEQLAKKAKHLTTQAKVGDEYMHDDIGYNYRLVNVLAAIGVAQMELLPSFIKKKKKIDAYYRQQLAGVGDIRFQKTDQGVNPNCWLFTFLTNQMRDLLDCLNKQAIQSRPFWVPMNQLPMFKDDIFISEHNYSKQVYDESISIPCSIGITDEQMQTVVKAIQQFYNN
jgi:perosamine synthetase